jgi:predicted lipoprotein with Yx(FWY)xxD motif
MLTAAARTTREPGGPAGGWPSLGLRLAGAGLLIATGAIHLDLYLTGYRSIPTIGWLFLLQVIAAFALGLAVTVAPRRLVAAAGAGFCLTTLGGYLLSMWIGLFGFKEVRTTAGVVAGVIEIAGFAALAALTLRAEGGARGWDGPRLQTAWRAAGATATGLSLLALVLLGVAVAGASTPAATATGGTLATTSIHGVTVLTNAQGATLYWFTPDTRTASKCYGSCAAYWPPVTGHPVAGPGITGQLGTIQRSGGGLQATYDGHPLYTYVGDRGRGQANGNNLDLNGGVWHEVTVTG